MPELQSMIPPAAAGMRSTTGQSLAVHYDVRCNTLTFAECDWFAAPLRSGGVPGRSAVRQRLDAAAKRTRLRR